VERGTAHSTGDCIERDCETTGRPGGSFDWRSQTRRFNNIGYELNTTRTTTTTKDETLSRLDEILWGAKQVRRVLEGPTATSGLGDRRTR